MAYDPYLAERIERILQEKKVIYTAKKMMGGYLFSVDDKLMCGIHIDKKFGDSLLMARIGEKAYEAHIEQPECLPMDFTGRPMKGYIFITPEGFDMDDDLADWVQLALDFNSIAKSSRKK